MKIFLKDLKKQTNPAIIKIADYLKTRTDMNETLDKENKSLSEMYKYIRQQAMKEAINGCAFISDEEVYSMAVHYYDEDDIKVEDHTKAVVKTSKPVQKTEEKSHQAHSKKEKIADGQMSMFDMFKNEDI